MNAELKIKQRKILVIVQIAMVVIGILLGINDLAHGYIETFADFGGEFVVLPIALAGLVRFGIRAYQIASIKFGRKIYDEEGNSLTVTRRGLGVVVGIACPFVLAGLFGMLAGISMLLQDILATVLLLVVIFLFVMDIRFLKSAK